jgi:hypothetical protein
MLWDTILHGSKYKNSYNLPGWGDCEPPEEEGCEWQDVFDKDDPTCQECEFFYDCLAELFPEEVNKKEVSL